MAVASSIVARRVGLLYLILCVAPGAGFPGSILEILEDEMLESPRPQYDNHAIGRSLAGSPESWTVAVNYTFGSPTTRIPRYCMENRVWSICPWVDRFFDDNGVAMPLALTDRFRAYQPWFADGHYEIWVEPLQGGDFWLQITVNRPATALALDGGTFAYGLPTGGIGSGTVVTYEYAFMPGWQQTGSTNGPPVVGAAYGAALDVDGDLLVVGAPHTDTGFPGKAFVFVRDWGNSICPDAWCLIDVLERGQPDDDFGRAIAVDKDWIVIGAPGYDSTLPSFVDRGKIYLYERGAELVTLHHSVEGAGPGCSFGASLEMYRTNVLVGAPGESATVPPHTFEDVGAAYLYRRSGNRLEAIARLSSSLIQPGTESGTAVALTDFSALVGAPYLDLDGDIDRGTVLIYNGLVTQFFDGFESGDLSEWSGAVP